MRLAYLLSRYPAISHTFLLQEVLGLRTLGLHIETASINPPDRAPQNLSQAERVEASRTFYLKSGPKPRALLILTGVVLRHPAVLFRGLAAVLGTPDLPLRRRIYWLAYLAEAILLGGWMRRNRIEHLHVHFGGAVATVGMLTSVAWRIPYSLTLHGPEELQNIASYHLRQKLRQASFVLCISHFCQSQLMQITPPDQWPKFHVLRLGVSQDLLDRPTHHTLSDGSAGAPVHLLCVGRLVPEKGQHLLLHAAALLLQQGLQLHLTLAGDGSERQSLERLAAQLRLGYAITFAGATSHAATLDLCASADIFVLPSFAEGIPVALMEAMALAVPCISTTVAGIPELVRSGTDGLLVAPSDLDALTAALQQVIHTPQLRRQFGNSAREQVRRLYNLSQNHRQLALVLQQQITQIQGSSR